jgi:hypothetical protein
MISLKIPGQAHTTNQMIVRTKGRPGYSGGPISSRRRYCLSERHLSRPIGRIDLSPYSRDFLRSGQAVLTPEPENDKQDRKANSLVNVVPETPNLP